MLLKGIALIIISALRLEVQPEEAGTTTGDPSQRPVPSSSTPRSRAMREVPLVMATLQGPGMSEDIFPDFPSAR